MISSSIITIVIITIFAILDIRFSRERKTFTYLQMVGIAVGLAAQPILIPSLGLTPTVLSIIAGVLCVSIAFILIAWARYHLGRFYTEGAKLQENHRIIQTGPYKHVRHPFFSALFLLTFGMLLIMPTLPMLVLFIYTIIDFTGAAYRDEKLLLKHLPEEYRNYKATTPMFIPIRFKDFVIESTVIKTINDVRRYIIGITTMGLILISATTLIMVIGLDIIISATNYSDQVLALFGNQWLSFHRFATYASSILMLLFGLIVLYVNKNVSSIGAGYLLVSLLIVITLLCDRPEEITDGRSLILFTMPIMISSFIAPSASFIVTGIVILTISAVRLSMNYNLINPFTVFVLITISLIAWIVMHLMTKLLNIVQKQDNYGKLSTALKAIDNHPRDDIIAVISLDGELIYGNRQLKKILMTHNIPGEIGHQLPEHEVHQTTMSLAKQTVTTGQPVRQLLEYAGDMYDLVVGPFELENKKYVIFNVRRVETIMTGDVPFGITYDPDTGVVTRVNRRNSGPLKETTLFRIGERGIFVYDKDAREEVPFGWDTLRDLAERVIPNPA